MEVLRALANFDRLLISTKATVNLFHGIFSSEHFCGTRHEFSVWIAWYSDCKLSLQNCTVHIIISPTIDVP